jgi:uncharacterized protein YbcC (UPF0753/DUF2309 family)
MIVSNPASNSASSPAPVTACEKSLMDSIAKAGSRIAPTWPLDRFIAVNPYWGWIDQPAPVAARQLHRLAGAPLLMPRSYYREQWQAGVLQVEHFAWVVSQADTRFTVSDLIRQLDEPPNTAQGLRLVAEHLDSHRDLHSAMAWRQFITHQISQHCAAHFDRDQALWRPSAALDLYTAWRDSALLDKGPFLQMHYRGFAEQVRLLPTSPVELIFRAVEALGVPEAGREDYLTALLLDINGWASWCAYRHWQATLAGGTCNAITALLAIRLAWEWLLYQEPSSACMHAHWQAYWRNVPDGLASQNEDRAKDWLLQCALERAYQAPLCKSLLAAPKIPAQTPVAAPILVQAAFCIDVRSEVFRRALESCDPGIETLGFAGFFGLPIAYSPIGTDMLRPQLPGLLSPTLNVSEVGEDTTEKAAKQRRYTLSGWRAWRNFRTSASSGFSFVEAIGPLYVGKLLKQSIAQAGWPGHRETRLRLSVENAKDKVALDAPTKAALVAGILRAMGLTQNFARIVLLAGHGSQSANNPHAAGLDCGACGGQTGEVNARLLASLLNDRAVREVLRQSGIHLPQSTWFVAALHNTTTDEFDLFDLALLPDTHVADMTQLRAWLRQAGELSRAERSVALGLAAEPAGTGFLLRQFTRRANDWAQVRPEWGLVNNAAFIVAPRRRTKHLDLGGRSFLHDYDWHKDVAFSTLELIMTAPMIVTNWINMQYYASTVDPQRYGSGNKVLHNVVGGHLGVFEGNGGDLRIGLPWQSLHDGERLMHTPLRLSVFIEAPQEAIAAIVDKHETVRRLVDHEWLYLFRIDESTQAIERYLHNRWHNS